MYNLFNIVLLFLCIGACLNCMVPVSPFVIAYSICLLFVIACLFVSNNGVMAVFATVMITFLCFLVYMYCTEKIPSL